MATDEQQADSAAAASASRPPRDQERTYRGQRCGNCPHRKRDMQASVRRSLFAAALVAALGLIAGLLVAAGLIAVAHVSDGAMANGAGRFSVAFADPRWDGKHIPQGEHCRKWGGNGASPALRVTGIPKGADAILVAFNDRSYRPLSYDGGHGTVGYDIADGARSALLPSVPGESHDLPGGVFMAAPHRGSTSPGTAYLPPCSGGIGNSYFAVVKAVRFADPEARQGIEVLGERILELGRY